MPDDLDKRFESYLGRDDEEAVGGLPKRSRTRYTQWPARSLQASTSLRCRSRSQADGRPPTPTGPWGG